MSQRIMLCFLLLTTFSYAFAERDNLSFKNEPDGFRGIKWGTPISANKSSMKFYNKDDGLDEYKRKNDKMQIGDAKLRVLKYIYFNNKLTSIEALTDFGGDYDKLTEILEARFGDSRIDLDYRYFQKGETTTIKYSCGWVLGSSETCKLKISSTVLLKKYNNYLKTESAKK